MNEDETVEVQEERPRRGRRAKAEQSDDSTEQKLNVGIHFGIDMGAAVVVVCPYSRRREFAERLFSEYRNGEGLLLRVPACGQAINYQAADRIPLGWNSCGCGKHAMIKWMEGE